MERRNAAHLAKLEDKDEVINKCKKETDEKQLQLNICKNKYEKELAENIRQETLACVTREDELSHTLRILKDMNVAKDLYTYFMNLAVKQQFMEEEDKEISRQLAMSKPLVTEMLTFIS